MGTERSGRVYLGLAAIGVAGIVLAGCAGGSAVDIAKDVRTAVLGVVEAVAVKGVITEADAAIIGKATAGDKILDAKWTEKVKDADLPGFLAKLRDKAVDAVAELCVNGYLSPSAAASISVPGAVEGDPVWAGNCSEIIRAGE